MNESFNIKKEVEQKKDELVKFAHSVFERYQKTPTSTQFENLRTVASSTESFEEVKNYIRYQMGRHDEWRAEANNQKFGDYLIIKINEIKNSSSPQAVMPLLRLLFGYLAREKKYFEEIMLRGESNEQRKR